MRAPQKETADPFALPEHGGHTPTPPWGCSWYSKGIVDGIGSAPSVQQGIPSQKKEASRVKDNHMLAHGFPFLRKAQPLTISRLCGCGSLVISVKHFSLKAIISSTNPKSSVRWNRLPSHRSKLCMKRSR